MKERETERLWRPRHDKLEQRARIVRRQA